MMTASCKNVSERTEHTDMWKAEVNRWTGFSEKMRDSAKKTSEPYKLQQRLHLKRGFLPAMRNGNTHLSAVQLCCWHNPRKDDS